MKRLNDCSRRSPTGADAADLPAGR